MDFYQVLELDSRLATDTEIKAAYRKLARKWHPDVNKSPRAAFIFQNLTQAFETLGDEQRRSEYDERETQLHHQERSYQRPGGTDLHIALSVQLEEAVLGGTHRLSTTALSQCPQCRGSGGAPGGRSERCQCCKGRGDIFKTRTAIPSVGSSSGSSGSSSSSSSTILAECPACAGRGILIIDCCPRCEGVGLAKRTRAIEIRVPAGIEDGTSLKVAGGGNASEGGGPQGDLFVRIHVRESEALQRKGMDLYSSVSVPLFIAILGGFVNVKTFVGGKSSGETRLRVPPGTSHGCLLSLKGQGVLGQGAHHFMVRVQVPREVSEEQVAVLRRLRTSQYNR